MKKQTKTFSVILLLCVLLGISSCSDSKTSLTSNTPEDVSSIYKLANDLEVETQNGTILSSSTQADRDRIISAVRIAKNAVAALSLKSRNVKYLYALNNAIKDYQATDKIVKDEYKLDIFFSKAAMLAKKYAFEMGVDLSDLDWKQFEYNFSSGVSPFGGYADVTAWSTDWQQDQPLALVKGTGTSSWLISPEFDLTNATKASFEFEHMFGADANSREALIEFNRAKFIKEVFRVKVSTNYEGGDPSSAKWVDIKLKKIPTGVDFHKIKSSLLSLDKFVGQKITIAFHYNANSKFVGRHYLNWNIYDFKLYANEVIGSVIKRPGPILTDKFSSNLGDFQNVSLHVDSSKFTYGSGGGKEFAVINSNGTESTTWLISARYDLSKVTNASLLIKQIAKNLDLSKAKIFVSDSYEGGDPSLSKWERIPNKNDDTKTPDSWTDLMTGPFDLKNYIGKNIVIGFEFTQNVSDASTWEIINLDFIGEGSEIRKSKVEISYESPEPPKDETKELVAEILMADSFASLKYEIKEGTPSDFFVNSKGEQKSVRISGFKNKNVGVARLTTDVIATNAKSNLMLVLDHSINFAKDIDPRELVKIYVKDAQDDSQEYPVTFENFPAGTSFNTVSSGPFLIPESLTGKDLKVIFEYKSFDPNFVTWDIYKLSVFEQK